MGDLGGKVSVATVAVAPFSLVYVFGCLWFLHSGVEMFLVNSIHQPGRKVVHKQSS